MVDRSAERQVRGNGVGKNNLPSIYRYARTLFEIPFQFVFLLLSILFSFFLLGSIASASFNFFKLILLASKLASELTQLEGVKVKNFERSYF